MTTAPTTVDEYLEGFDGELRARLDAVRAALLRAVPGAEEKVRYGMPAVLLGGRYAIHYAGWKRHIGLYPVARAEEPLESELAPHRSGTDTLEFRHTAPLDLDLIERIGRFCAAHRAAVEGS